MPQGKGDGGIVRLEEAGVNRKIQCIFTAALSSNPVFHWPAVASEAESVF